MIRRRITLTRLAPMKRKRAKRKPGRENPQYRAWIRTWPCWICFERYCRKLGYDPAEERARPEVRSMFCALQAFECGVTEAAHAGARGLGQKCPDSQLIPLGGKHHMHATAGGSKESHHSMGKNFWEYHHLNTDEIFEELHGLYRKETGRKV